MSDSGNIFRSSVFGGFNKQDVLTYIEEKTQAHSRELGELRRALEQSRKELDEARDELSRSREEAHQLQAASDTRQEELLRLQSELESLRSENSDLSRALEERDAELGRIRAEKDRLEEKWNEVQEQLGDIEQAKLLVANIELEAHARAKKIENEAIENASMARAALTNLFQDAKRRFDNTKESASRTLLRISQELDRLKEVLKHLPGSFDAISGEIEALKFGSDKKNAESAPDTPDEEHDESLNEMQYGSIVYPIGTAGETPVDTHTPDPDDAPEEETPAVPDGAPEDEAEDDEGIVYTFDPTASSEQSET